MNDFPNYIKSVIKLFADDVKVLLRPLSKETTQMDINKLPYWEDIWKLEFYVEKVKYYILDQKTLKLNIH